jgi:hypothetical protein
MRREWGTERGREEEKLYNGWGRGLFRRVQGECGFVTTGKGVERYIRYDAIDDAGLKVKVTRPAFACCHPQPEEGL